MEEIHNGILLSHKNTHKIMPLAAAWMELESLVLSEVRKTKTNTVPYHFYAQSTIWHR